MNKHPPHARERMTPTGGPWVEKTAYPYISFASPTAPLRFTFGCVSMFCPHIDAVVLYVDGEYVVTRICSSTAHLLAQHVKVIHNKFENVIQWCGA